jgi:hypothetical protein
MHPVVRAILQSGGGSGKAYFDGSGDYLSLADSEDWNYGTGDFCEEISVQFNALPGPGTFVTLLSQSIIGTGTKYLILRNTSGTYTLEFSGDAVGAIAFTRTVSVSVGQLYHFAISREGSAFRMFQNGSKLGADYTNTGNLINATSVFGIAAYIDSAILAVLNGYIHNVRITKGRARYTANFTPPTSFSIDGSDVKLCMNFAEPIGSTTFIDETGKTITTYGNVVIVA